MIERDKTRQFIEEVEELWDTLVPASIGESTREWVKTKLLGGAMEDLRRLVLEGRTPRMFLVGQSGHGKSSLINALCGKAVAKVGHVMPETSESCPYHVVFDGSGTSWDLVDSRGLFESSSPDGGPAEDVVEITIREVLDHKPDVIVHVVAMPGVRALAKDLEALERIRAQASRALGQEIPSLMVLTKADTIGDPRQWPPEQHPGKAGLVSEKMRYVTEQVLGVDCSQTKPLQDIGMLYGHQLDGHPHCTAVVPVCVLEGRLWNIATLQDFIGHQLPEEAQLHYYQALGRKDLLRKVSGRVTRRFSEIAAAVGASPLPVADVIVLSPLQLLLMAIIGGLSCRPVALETVKDYMVAVGGMAGIVVTLRTAAQQLVKLVPVYGPLVSGAFASAGTYAIGKSAEAYFFAGKKVKPKKMLDEQPPPENLAEQWMDEPAQGDFSAPPG